LADALLLCPSTISVDPIVAESLSLEDAGALVEIRGFCDN
jgi:hypothetical protein